MSATIIDPERFARDLGLQRDEWEWLELPSSFPKQNRPVFHRPAGSTAFRHRDETLPRMISALDAILDDYPERVLGHTHTYGIARQVITASRHRGRMLTYGAAEERERALSAFTAAEGDVVRPATVVGLEGSTGFSTGPHLHFEVDRGCPAVGCSVDPGVLISLPVGA